MNLNVSQILLTTKKIKDLPNSLQKSSSSIHEYYRDHNIVLYDNDRLYEFINKYFGKEVIHAYESLNPLAYKADLGRYCLLYELGGWYFDIAIECIKKIPTPNEIDFICFRDEQRHSKSSWAVCNGIFWSKEKNKILSKCIDNIIINCNSKYYGRTPLCPTGPTLFGQAIAIENRDQNIIFGDLIRKNIPFTRKNVPILRKLIKSKFYLDDGFSYALLKPAKGGDLTSLGLKESNNYNNYWHSKIVYK